MLCSTDHGNHPSYPVLCLPHLTCQVCMHFIQALLKACCRILESMALQLLVSVAKGFPAEYLLFVELILMDLVAAIKQQPSHSKRSTQLGSLSRSDSYMCTYAEDRCQVVSPQCSGNWIIR